MKIKPLLTEKSLARSKKGKYTFLVQGSATASQIKDALENLFDVTVGKVWRLKRGAEVSFTRAKRRVLKAAQTVAIVTLKSGRLDFFETKQEEKGS